MSISNKSGPQTHMQVQQQIKITNIPNVFIFFLSFKISHLKQNGKHLKFKHQTQTT